jgi:hypothetical protein
MISSQVDSAKATHRWIVCKKRRRVEKKREKKKVQAREKYINTQIAEFKLRISSLFFLFLFAKHSPIVYLGTMKRGPTEVDPSTDAGGECKYV